MQPSDLKRIPFPERNPAWRFPTPSQSPLVAPNPAVDMAYVPQQHFTAATESRHVKLLVLSDLHLEFAPFIPDSVAVAKADVVVLAGDIHLGTQGIVWARDAFPDKPVVYVAGNHEFYRGHWDRTLEEMRQVAQERDIHFLENTEATLAGVRFLGCSLWTDFDYFGAGMRTLSMAHAENRLADFRMIEAPPLQGRESIVLKSLLKPQHTVDRHRISRAWLEQALTHRRTETVVVVTHHHPHQRSESPRFKGDALTPAFGSRLPQELLTQADLWIHGHTHDSAHYFLGQGREQVRVVCNPRGYPFPGGRFENDEFDPGYLVEV